MTNGFGVTEVASRAVDNIDGQDDKFESSSATRVLDAVLDSCQSSPTGDDMRDYGGFNRQTWWPFEEWDPAATHQPLERHPCEHAQRQQQKDMLAARCHVTIQHRCIGRLLYINLWSRARKKLERSSSPTTSSRVVVVPICCKSLFLSAEAQKMS